MVTLGPFPSQILVLGVIYSLGIFSHIIGTKLSFFLVNKTKLSLNLVF